MSSAHATRSETELTTHSERHSVRAAECWPQVPGNVVHRCPYVQFYSIAIQHNRAVLILGERRLGPWRDICPAWQWEIRRADLDE